MDRLHSQATVSWYGEQFFITVTCDLHFINTTMNATSFIEVLETAFPTIKKLFRALLYIYQKDNAPIHTARFVKCYIAQILEPPYSPNLNIVENVCGWLSSLVYESGKQCLTVPEFKLRGAQFKLITKPNFRIQCETESTKF